jgi:hypothetical protein
MWINILHKGDSGDNNNNNNNNPVNQGRTLLV